MTVNENPTQSENPAAPGDLPAAATPPIQLWVVDDNKRVRESIKDALASFEGIHCTATFASPNALLSALASRKGPDVILLDIHMGEANGVDAVRPIKTLSRSTQVLMFTAVNDPSAKKQALSEGASDFLLKGFPLEKILDSIHRAHSQPVPHLRHSNRQRKPRERAVEKQRERSPWVKHCLDALRRFRN